MGEGKINPEQRIKAYFDALEASGMSRDFVRLRYVRGWYQMATARSWGFGMSSKYRAKQIDEMIDRLRARAATPSEGPPHDHQ